MRDLVYAINITLDGCCDHTRTMVNDDILEYHTRLLLEADTFVFGRKTFELMVPYWPDIARNHSSQSKADSDFAMAFDSINKTVVLSRSLYRAVGKNTRIVRENLRDEIIRLKQEGGKNILVGGVDIPSQLVQLGLVDEFHFVIQPIVVGAGRRLFEELNLQERVELKLVDLKIFPSGAVAHRYRKSQGS